MTVKEIVSTLDIGYEIDKNIDGVDGGCILAMESVD